jgi:transposase InsO family protein
VYTEEQLRVLEAGRREREHEPDEIETHHPGYLLAQDIFYVGYIKGVGRIYQQTVIDTYSSVVFAKLYTSKVPVTAADVLNDRVPPFFQDGCVDVLRIMTDRGTEYCGRLDKHPYQLYLQLYEIEHTKTKARNPQTNGICERFHKTILDEFYRVVFRKKIFHNTDELQTDLDMWLEFYNQKRTHQGKRCQGKTPMQTFAHGLELAEKANLTKEEKLAA